MLNAFRKRVKASVNRSTYQIPDSNITVAVGVKDSSKRFQKGEFVVCPDCPIVQQTVQRGGYVECQMCKLLITPENCQNAIANKKMKKNKKMDEAEGKCAMLK